MKHGPATLWGLPVTRALGLLLVPLIIAGLFIWGLWDPTTRLHTVTAAVVNNDEPVEVEGQYTPLGRVLAAELIGTTESENFEWVLTDDEDAADGLASGEYVTVVTIPENFSAAATSLARGPEEAEQATIDIQTSERAKLLDAALSAAITSTATQVLNTQLGEVFVGNVFVGMTQLGEGLGEASDGASELADGIGTLADGTGELATGTAQFADGATQLADGVGQLSAGASQLAGGVSEFARGTSALQGGVSELATGTGQLASGLNAYADGVEELADGTQQAADGSALLAQGVGEYTGMINEALVPISGVLGDAMPYVEQLRDAIISGELPVPEEQRQQMLGIIDQVLQAPGMLELAIEGGAQLAEGSLASAEGLQELSDGAKDLAAGARGLAAGADELAGGTRQLAGELPALTQGANQLAEGAGSLAAGVGGLHTGAAELASGAGDLAGGVQELADGTVQVSDGSRDLARGLAEAVAEIPSYTDDETETLAKLALNPVEGGGERSLFAGSGAPLFLSVALWAGALASFMLLTPLWRRTRDAALSEAAITVRSAAPGLAVGVLQGVLAAFLVAVVLGATAGEMLAYALTGGLVGIAFALMNQGVVALFGGYGRFVAFLVLVIGFVAGIVSTAPGILGQITAVTPIGTAIRVFENIALTGNAGLGPTLMLIVWAGIGFVILGAAVHRARNPKGELKIA